MLKDFDTRSDSPLADFWVKWLRSIWQGFNFFNEKKIVKWNRRSHCMLARDIPVPGPKEKATTIKQMRLGGRVLFILWSTERRATPNHYAIAICSCSRIRLSERTLGTFYSLQSRGFGWSINRVSVTHIFLVLNSWRLITSTRSWNLEQRVITIIIYNVYGCLCQIKFLPL